MARRRRSRRYGSYVQIPGLAGVLDPIKKSVRGSDVLVGAAIGAVGGPFVQGLLEKTNILSKLPDMLQPYVPALTSALSGVGLYFVQKKSAQGTGHMIGALATGAALAAPIVKAKFFGGIVSLPMYGRYGYGALVDEVTPRVGPGGYGGLLVDEPMRAMSDGNLAQLAAFSMSDNEQADMESLMESY